MAQDKATRILDAAEELLLAFGYRKVTIDEVAVRARVGKGTVYLYWASKQELFAAVLTRDVARRLTEQLATLSEDPAEVQLHRTMRRTYVQAMSRPLARALATGDHARLGEVLASPAGAWLTRSEVETTARLLALLHQHGLLTDDPAADPAVLHRLSAVALGSFLLEAGTPGTDAVPGAELDVEGKADALVTTVRRAFEPPTVPTQATLQAAAGELADLYRQWLAELTAALPDSASATERT